MRHVPIEPAIHYWGTPVVLVSTVDERGAVNVAPMSSVFWLGWSAMLGLDASSRTTENLIATRECVLNLADEGCVEATDRLALTTGRPSVPLHKRLLGYRHVPDKLAHAGLHALPATKVRPPRVAEARVHLECAVERIRPFAKNDLRMAVPAVAVEVRIVAAHADGALLSAPDRIDPTRWRPLVMSFRRFFGLSDELRASRLSRGPEEGYAPWKGSALRQVAGGALRSVAHAVHGVGEPEE